MELKKKPNELECPNTQIKILFILSQVLLFLGLPLTAPVSGLQSLTNEQGKAVERLHVFRIS